VTGPANVDLVRAIYAGWERGDFSSTDWADPQIEYAIFGGPVSGAWAGLDGMALGWHGWLDAWADYRTEVEEYRQLDDERVLVLTHDSGRGKASGLDLGEMGGPKAAVLFHVRQGKVTRLIIYFDRERAFADLRLAEQAQSPGA
jgi:ketosteroid isomerase-like protein